MFEVVNVEPYLLYGVILPERAVLTMNFSLYAKHGYSGIDIRMEVSIVLNQLLIWIFTDSDWDLYDLRNVVSNVVRDHLGIVGYLMGYAYDFDMRRVVHRTKGIDLVYGIDVAVITNRLKRPSAEDIADKLAELSKGTAGNFIRRCFSDLISAIRYDIDTAFYCYRAVESLRHHNSFLLGLSNADKSSQWGSFRSAAKSSEKDLRFLKDLADPLRHGEVDPKRLEDREHTLALTWEVVDNYIAHLIGSGVPEKKPNAPGIFVEAAVVKHVAPSNLEPL